MASSEIVRWGPRGIVAPRAPRQLNPPLSAVNLEYLKATVDSTEVIDNKSVNVCSEDLISCPFSAEIKPNEKVLVKIHDCFVTFPENSCERNNEIQGKLEIDPKLRSIRIGNSRPHIVISPMLFLKSRECIRKLVTVKLTSWCVNNPSKFASKAKVDVLHLPDGSDKWEIFTTLPFNSETEFQFETLDFSPYALGLREDYHDLCDYVLMSSLYADYNDNFTFVFQLKSDLLSDHIRKELYPSKKVKFVIEARVTQDDELTGDISAENLTFKHENSFPVSVNALRGGDRKWEEFTTFLNDHNVPDDGFIILNYKVERNDDVVKAGQFKYKLKKGVPDPETIAQNVFHAQNVQVIQDEGQQDLPPGIQNQPEMDHAHQPLQQENLNNEELVHQLEVDPTQKGHRAAAARRRDPHPQQTAVQQENYFGYVQRAQQLVEQNSFFILFWVISIVIVLFAYISM